ncbi:AfsR/SARP family transcriptional regulator [Streptomyces radicis]|uniref:AfsR family transcriptional regulator n=1 Tax=Streptomyces radicis TaxID=1750517 RepID=A0A3A9W014_9ACTN|nr:BTAD domain-containing putative transcriptional regulator [Streptomyces radicis]RKN06300.1 AfsR family transcriptional regulator [Streptomyces radicis]RKN18630.1 AfsR family transcriptional regulator [Streptomyces radicis]
MRFHVLGPLAMSEGQETVVLQPSKPANLLAALLLHSNTVVSSDYLQRMVWGDTQPATARAALQTCVLRLRRLFTRHGVLDAAIEAVPGGYRITANAGSLDLVDFRETVVGARAAEDPETELALLRAALSLWQGAPLPNVRSGALHRDEVPRLVEERLAAQTRVCDLLLALGRHGAALVELWGHTRAHPDHGRFREQLIEALYRSGRQTEALAECRRFKEHLARELGIGPSAALRDLELAILRGEALGPVAGAAAASAPPALPPVPWFTGRAREVAVLVDRLGAPAEAPVLELVCGAPGIGKTALVQHVAHVARDRFPGGRLLVRMTDAAGAPRPAAEVTAELAAGLPAPGAGWALLLLDDVADAEQARPALAAAAGCAVLITSRRKLAGLIATHGGRVHRLETFAAEESHALLAAVLGGDRVAGEPVAARELADRCGHHPLALLIAAARLMTRPALPLADGARWLADDPLAHLALTDDPGMSVGRVLAAALDRLDPGLAEAFLTVGRLPSPVVGAADCAGLPGFAEPVAEAAAVLERLADAGLLEDGPPGPYRVHELLRLYAGHADRGRVRAREKV